MEKEEARRNLSKRQEFNRKILEVISKRIEEAPYMRFCQLLWSLGIHTYDALNNDLFYEEPIETLKRINDRL